MTKIVYRVYRKNDTELIAAFSEEKHAEQLAKRLDFKVYIQKVLINDEGMAINV